MKPVQRHNRQSLRTFVAVKVNANKEITGFLDDTFKKLREENIRRVKPENFHITLRFIGETLPEKIELIKESLNSAAGASHSFRFLISGIGVFPGLRAPKVLWLGVKDPGELRELKVQVDKVLLPLINSDMDPKFNPHLTIGRMKKLDDPVLMEEIINSNKNRIWLDVEVKEIILFESLLMPDGPVYRALSVHPLE